MERILVVEDDLALSAGLLFELDSAGYVSVPAYNCAKAKAGSACGRRIFSDPSGREPSGWKRF